MRLRRAAVWVCAIVLAVAFVAVGASKLGGPSALRWAERFGRWGYPANAQYVVGVVELLGGLAVLIPRWRRAATAALGALMVGALLTHAAAGEFPRLVPPLVLGALSGLLAVSSARPNPST